MKQRFALLYFLLSFSFDLVAQQGIFTFYSVNDGLAQSTVTCLYRDTFGLLWVGTGDGLSVFNGYEFRNFKSSLDDSSQISNSRIRSVHPFLNGSEIWVGTEDGMNGFSKIGNHVVKKIGYPQFAGNISTPLYFNDTAAWFFLPSKGIFKKRENSTIPTIVLSTTFQFRIYHLLVPGEILYQTAFKELKSYNVLTRKEFVFSLPSELKDKNIYDAAVLQSGVVLLATDNGIWQIRKGKVERYLFNDGNWSDVGKKINAICEDANGRIWMGVYGDGLYVFDPQGNTVRPAFWEQTGISVRSKLRQISTLLADPYGIVWAGTDGSGLVKITTDRLFFGKEYFSPVVTDSCNWFVKALYKDPKNRLWVGTFRDGVKMVDYEQESIASFDPFKGFNKSVNTITAIVPAFGNSLYFGTSNGLWIYDTLLKTSKNINLGESTDGNQEHVNCILKRKDGQVIVGTNRYLYCIVDGKSGPMAKRYFPNSMNVTALHENTNGQLTIAAMYAGLYRLDEHGSLIDSLLFADGKTLPGSVFINGFAAGNGDSFYASSNFGLIKFSKNLTVEKIFSVMNGLPDNMVYGIVQLPDNTFFISTGMGVSVFNPQENRFENYSVKDGLKSDECNAGALYFSSDNSIYVGGVNGFNVKHFPFETIPTIQPKIYVEKIAVFDLPFTAAAASEQLELNYQQNTFSFQLWQTDFTFSDRTNFTYQLEGFDPGTVNSGGRRFVRYAGVEPGNFKFKVGMTFPGYAAPAMLELMSVKIIPPYWQSTWFRVFAFIAIMGFIALIVYLILHSRYKKVMRQMELQHELERVRIRISGDIHDDLGAGLTRIALSSDLVSRQLEEGNPLKSKIKNMAISARDLSQSLKEVVWSVKPEYDQLDSMVSYFKGYCGELFEDTSISFSFATLTEIPPLPISPELRRNLFLILKESCNNAMKHSGATKVETRFSCQDGMVDLEIKDNGCGIAINELSSEMNRSGLKNMENRAKAIGWDFNCSENEWGGCSIRVLGTV